MVEAHDEADPHEQKAAIRFMDCLVVDLVDESETRSIPGSASEVVEVGDLQNQGHRTVISGRHDGEEASLPGDVALLACPDQTLLVEEGAPARSNRVPLGGESLRFTEE